MVRKLQRKKDERALLFELRAVLEAGLRALRREERRGRPPLPAVGEPNWSPRGWAALETLEKSES